MKIIPILIIIGIVSFMLFRSSNNKPKVNLEKATTEQADSTSINYGDMVEKQLTKSDTTLSVIEQTINQKDALQKENKQLKVELKATKDSLVATKKLIKKRTFIQKILGTNKDTTQNLNDTIK